MDRVQVVANTKGASAKMNNLNNFYVAVSRHKLNVKIFVDNKENLQKQVKIEQKKTSTLDFANNNNNELNKKLDKNFDNFLKNNLQQKNELNKETKEKLEKIAENAKEKVNTKEILNKFKENEKVQQQEVKRELVSNF